MDELFAESGFAACCMLLWHIKQAVSDIFLPTHRQGRQQASIACASMSSVDAGGSIIV